MESSCCRSFKTWFLFSSKYVHVSVVCTLVTALDLVAGNGLSLHLIGHAQKNNWWSCLPHGSVHQSISSFGMIVMGLARQVTIEKLSHTTCKFNMLTTTKRKGPTRRCNVMCILLLTDVLAFILVLFPNSSFSFVMTVMSLVKQVSAKTSWRFTTEHHKVWQTCHEKLIVSSQANCL